jgi:Ser/Thr protein kinase RdoA (MazF antagonist)
VADDPLAGAVMERLGRAVAVFASAGGDAALERLAALRPGPQPVQPVLRDVWADHVLFAAAPADRVAGFIDFHAAGLDSPAADVARLLGSWRRPGGEGRGLLAGWGDAVAAYEAWRPLPAAERGTIPLFHATGVVFGLDNWFGWVLEEGRTFARPGAVLERIDRLLESLPEALHELATIAPISEGGAI